VVTRKLILDQSKQNLIHLIEYRPIGIEKSSRIIMRALIGVLLVYGLAVNLAKFLDWLGYMVRVPRNYKN